MLIFKITYIGQYCFVIVHVYVCECKELTEFCEPEGRAYVYISCFKSDAYCFQLSVYMGTEMFVMFQSLGSSVLLDVCWNYWLYVEKFTVKHVLSSWVRYF
jgi:hypothetical protein